MKKFYFVMIALALLTSCSKGQDSQVAGGKPTYLYKVLSLGDWGKSCRTIQLSSMDAAFIHFSTDAQLDKIIAKYWSDVSEYVVLKVETAKLPGNLVLEANPGGTVQYYHLYNGSIPLTAVTEMKVRKK